MFKVLKFNLFLFYLFVFIYLIILIFLFCLNTELTNNILDLSKELALLERAFQKSLAEFNDVERIVTFLNKEFDVSCKSFVSSSVIFGTLLFTLSVFAFCIHPLVLKDLLFLTEGIPGMPITHYLATLFSFKGSLGERAGVVLFDDLGAGTFTFVLTKEGIKSVFGQMSYYMYPARLECCIHPTVIALVYHPAWPRDPFYAQHLNITGYSPELIQAVCEMSRNSPSFGFFY